MTPTISVTLSTDGTYLTLKDLTPIEEYIGAGIDIDTDIVSVTYTLTNSTPTDYPLVITSDFLTSVRDVNGLVITTTDLTYGAEFFADGRYTSTMDLVEDSSGSDVTHTGTSDDIFYSQILQIIVSQIKDADWKDLYNPYSERFSSDLRKKMGIIDINYATYSGLLDEAERIRLSLNKMCSYVG